MLSWWDFESPCGGKRFLSYIENEIADVITALNGKLKVLSFGNGVRLREKKKLSTKWLETTKREQTAGSLIKNSSVYSHLILYEKGLSSFGQMSFLQYLTTKLCESCFRSDSGVTSQHNLWWIFRAPHIVLQMIQSLFTTGRQLKVRDWYQLS